jgi:hypothetical protein
MQQETTVDRLPAAYHFLRSKWRNLLDELASLLTQIEAIAARGDDSSLNQKIADYRRYKAAALRLRRLIDEAAAG